MMSLVLTRFASLHRPFLSTSSEYQNQSKYFNVMSPFKYFLFISAMSSLITSNVCPALRFKLIFVDTACYEIISLLLWTELSIRRISSAVHSFVNKPILEPHILQLICAIGLLDHVTSSLRDLHGLPLEQRIIFILCSLVHHINTDHSPQYFRELVSLTTDIASRSQLHSATSRRHAMPATRLLVCWPGCMEYFTGSYTKHSEPSSF